MGLETELIMTYENLVIHLTHLFERYMANREFSTKLGIKSSSKVFTNPPRIHKFNSESNEMMIVREIQKLEKAILILKLDIYSLRMLFMLVSYGENDTIHALPKDVLNYCKVKYSGILYYYKFKKQNNHVSMEHVEKKNTKKVRFNIS